MITLVINPGGGSTKLAAYSNLEPIFEEHIRHPADELKQFPAVLDQFPYRLSIVEQCLERHLPQVKAAAEASRGPSQAQPQNSASARTSQPTASSECVRFNAIVTRGGTLKPLSGGVYRITEQVVTDIRAGRVQTMHPSLLGPLIAKELGDRWWVPAYFVDPESMDEFWPLSRLTGLPEIERRALSHALSLKSAGKRAAHALRKKYEHCNLVIAHLGTGITIAAHRRGRQVDASNANEDGPMAPQRSGSLPLEGLVNLCFAGLCPETPEPTAPDRTDTCTPEPKRTTADWPQMIANRRRDVLNRIQRQGGLLAHLGTDDLLVIEERIKAGDKQAQLVFDTMIYQIAKEIGAYSVALRGQVDAIVITGGMTMSQQLVNGLRSWIGRYARRILVYPMETEMKALVEAIWRLNRGQEKEQFYA